MSTGYVVIWENEHGSEKRETFPEAEWERAHDRAAVLRGEGYSVTVDFAD